MPTTASQTWSGKKVVPVQAPAGATPGAIALKASVTYLAGTLLGEVTATPGVYGAYATGNVDGTQLCTYILMYDCVTDASGNITFGAGPAGTSEWGVTRKTAPAWSSGIFATADLVGLDAGAVTKLGRLIQGSITNGLLSVYGP